MINNNSHNTLRILIHKYKGFDISHYKDSYIERRLNTRMNLTKRDDLKSYIELLRNNPEEFNKLIDALTVNVTEFFRNTETFAALETDIVPKILQNKETDSRDIIKVWSAGSSSGEETYTLAILFLEALRKAGKKYDLMVYGTDIDRKSIIKSKSGIYESNKVSGIRKDLLNRYFEEHGNEYRIKPFVKEHVKFSYLDLTSDFVQNLATYELILCRNVTIFFTMDVKRSLFMKFCQMLRKDGYLITGKNEAITGKVVDYLENVNLSERIYKKKYIPVVD
ncbi:MAG: chemotaxis protein methyltransferase CheR [Candidatus Methanocomedens sp.]|nr:MAG: chemotaxis protein methyltransferase CheR [ANME-2 cluster archaeon]